MVKEDQKQGQRREPLLPIADDDRAQKIVSVVGDGAALVAFLVALKELVGKVIDQFGNLLLLPLVFALIVVNRVLVAGKELSNGTTLPVDGAGRSGRRGHEKRSSLSDPLALAFAVAFLPAFFVAAPPNRPPSFARSALSSSSRASTSSRTSSGQRWRD